MSGCDWTPCVWYSDNGMGDEICRCPSPAYCPAAKDAQDPQREKHEVNAWLDAMNNFSAYLDEIEATLDDEPKESK